MKYSNAGSQWLLIQVSIKFSENTKCLSLARDSEEARDRDLKRLLPLCAYDVKDKTRESLLQLTAALRKALRQERQRGIAGDWTYSIQRHKALLARYRCEIKRLRSLQPQATAQKPGRMRKAD